MNNNTASSGEVGGGRDHDSYKVQSSDEQTMDISMNVVWKLDPAKILKIHQEVRGGSFDNTNHAVEEKLLRPILMKIAKDEATRLKATEAYAGEGLVNLQNVIFQRLTDSELEEQGVIVENFVIERIDLDPQYLEEIKLRQVAVQRELRSVQEEKAAIAEARKTKAEAQADYERKVVEAERDKAVGVLEAEKQAEQAILAAEADAKKVVLQAEAEKQRTVLGAEGEKESGELKAAAILALGQAEAEAQKLRLQAYAVPGADVFAKVEISKSMAEAFKNIKGYLPESMKLNVLTGSFNDGVKAVVETGNED